MTREEFRGRLMELAKRIPFARFDMLYNELADTYTVHFMGISFDLIAHHVVIYGDGVRIFRSYRHVRSIDFSDSTLVLTFYAPDGQVDNVEVHL